MLGKIELRTSALHKGDASHLAKTYYQHMGNMLG